MDLSRRGFLKVVAGMAALAAGVRPRTAHEEWALQLYDEYKRGDRHAVTYAWTPMMEVLEPPAVINCRCVMLPVEATT